MLLLLLLLRKPNRLDRVLLMVLAVLIWPSEKNKAHASAAGRAINTLPIYDDIVEGSAMRQGNLNVVNETLRVCRMVDIYPHTAVERDGTVVGWGGVSATRVQYTAAKILALEHLNTGNGSIIQEVEGLDKRCKIKFIGEFVDSQRSETLTVDKVIDILARDDEGKPCVFFGAFNSKISQSTALLTSLKGYAQFSSVSDADQLDNKELFPLFGRINPSNAQHGGPLFDFLMNELGVYHIAMAFSDDARSVSFSNGLREAVPFYPQLDLKSIGFAATTTNFSATVQAIKKTKHRYILAVVRNPHRRLILEEAYRQGIAGDGLHTWIFTNSFNPTDVVDASPYAKALAGSLEFITRAGEPGVGRYDALLDSWSNLANNEDDLAYIQSKLPPAHGSYEPVVVNKSFEVTRRTNGFSKAYDLTIAIGLAACEGTKYKTTLDGRSHYEEFLKTSFEGCSGTIKINNMTGSRDPTSALFVVNNNLPVSLDEDTDIVTFQNVQTHLYTEGKWLERETKLIFNDGTNNIPTDLPPPEVISDYVGTGMRVTGFVMSGIVLAATLAFAMWLQLSQKESRTLAASQPLFLNLICFGTFLIATSIIPLNMDDEVFSVDVVDFACMSFPWLLCSGWCLAFSALFTKARRINMIFRHPRFRRITVTTKDVIKPMIALLVVNTTILTLWSILSPLEWKREVVDYDEFDRPSETRGQCRLEDGLVYMLLLLFVNLGVLAFSVQQAYVARKISTEYSESEWIARCMTSILYVSILGIPVLIIADSQQAYTLVFGCIVFVVSMSLLCCILVPKVFYHYKAKQEMNPKSRKRLNISGIFSAFGNGLFSSSFHERENLEPRDNSMSSGRESSQILGTSDRGIRITGHPKYQEYLEETVAKLQAENEELKARLLSKKERNDAVAEGTTNVIAEGGNGQQDNNLDR